MFENGASIADHIAGQRFMRAQAGPSRTLSHCLTALRRGDRAIVLTARHGAELNAVVSQIARLCGPDLQIVDRMDAAEIASGMTARLRRIGVVRAVPWEPARADSRRDVQGRFLIVQNGQMLRPSDIAELVDLRDGHGGQAVQVLLTGNNHLLPLLCTPAADRFWQRVKLALCLERPDGPPADCDIVRLKEEISRTQARLEAQKRILSIFADSTAPAPRFDQ